MRAKLTFFAAVMLLLAMVGCKKSHELTGSWTMRGQDAIATFDPNGTFTIVDSKGGMDQTASGTYVLTDKELTLTTSAVKVSTKVPELEKRAAQYQKEVDNGKGNSNKQLIDWDGDDKFALFALNDTSFKGPHMVFSKQK